MSGGQTGVDRAALDVARAAGVPCGGWCPRGRWAEDGAIPADYPLRETPESDPRRRTERNVRDSDATLILARGALRGGTALTAGRARSQGRPLLVMDLDRDPDPACVAAWLAQERVHTLNIAGPRESQSPGIYLAARAFLERLLGATSTPAGEG